MTDEQVEAREDDEVKQEVAKNIKCILISVAIALLIAAIVLPMKVGDAWLTDNGSMMALLKFVELLLILGTFGCLVGLGGVKITASDEATMEWFGTILVMVGALFIGAFTMFKLVNVDEFASYRHLVAQRGARAVVEEPTATVDWETGEVTFKVDEAFQWVCVNVDYFDNDPLERKSKVFYHVPESGSWTFPSHEKAKRIGVFYGTGNGPSGENVVWNNEAILKKAREEASKPAATVTK